MPTNPIPPPTRAQSIAKAASRHTDAVALALGFLLGSVVAIVAGVLT